MSFSELSQHSTMGEQLSLSSSVSCSIFLFLVWVNRDDPILFLFLFCGFILRRHWEDCVTEWWLVSLHGHSCCFIFPLSLLLQAKIDTPPVTAIGAKAAPVMATKAAQPPLTGIGTVSSNTDFHHSHPHLPSIQLLPTVSILCNQCVLSHFIWY